MPMFRACTRLVAAAALTTLVLAPRPAWADQTGATVRVVNLTINTQGSDKYASFHGSVTVRAASSTETYFWGGTTCPAQSLSDAQIALLLGALNNRSRTHVVPRYRGDSSKSRCLVGFELVGAS
jgi:hypothetical protein